MSPWTVLGWVLVALIVIPIALRILIAACELGTAISRDMKRDWKRGRAEKGKVRCEFRDCTATATRRGASGYVCEGHTGTHLTRRGAVSFAFMLNHAKTDAKEAGQ